MTDLSEESMLEADRYASAVWSRLLACLKKLSSSQPEGQERLGGAEAAGLSGPFRSTRLRGHRWGNGRPRAPQTVVGGGCARAQLLPVDSFLGKECSLDREEKGVEWSLILLGMNCLRAADCVLAERNFSTTELTASPNSPDCEMGRPAGTPSPSHESL